MNPSLKPLYLVAKAAVAKVASCTTVAHEDNLEALEELAADLDGYIESTKDDIARKAKE